MKNDSLNSVGKRIKFALVNHPSGGKNQEWLKSEMGVSQAAVSQWSNDVQIPKNMVRLAEILNVDVLWLMNGDGDIFAAQHDIKNKYDSSLQPQIAERIGGVSFGPDTVPILGHANGSPDAVMLNPDNEIGRALKHPNQQGLSSAFALYARGDSMFPRYAEGELIYVASGLPVIKGKDCVIEMKNGEGFVKQYYKTTDTHIICKQLNPAMDWKRLLSEVKSVHAIVGRG